MTDDNLDLETIETLAEEQDNSQEIDETPDPKEKRHAEQLAGSRQEVERLRNLAVDLAFKEAQSDVNSLKELHQKDPKLAEKTADKFDRENSEWGSYSNFISGKVAKPAKEEKSSDDDFEKRYQERREQEEHEKSLSKLERKIGKLDEDLQEEVKTYIDKYSKGIKLTPETADELYEMATLYVNRDKAKADRKEEVKAQLSSTGVTGSKKLVKDELVPIIRNGKLVMVENNF